MTSRTVRHSVSATYHPELFSFFVGVPCLTGTRIRYGVAHADRPHQRSELIAQRQRTIRAIRARVFLVQRLLGPLPQPTPSRLHSRKIREHQSERQASEGRCGGPNQVDNATFAKTERHKLYYDRQRGRGRQNKRHCGRHAAPSSPTCDIPRPKTSTRSARSSWLARSARPRSDVRPPRRSAHLAGRWSSAGTGACPGARAARTQTASYDTERNHVPGNSPCRSPRESIVDYLKPRAWRGRATLCPHVRL